MLEALREIVAVPDSAFAPRKHGLLSFKHSPNGRTHESISRQQTDRRGEGSRGD